MHVSDQSTPPLVEIVRAMHHSDQFLPNLVDFMRGMHQSTDLTAERVAYVHLMQMPAGPEPRAVLANGGV